MTDGPVLVVSVGFLLKEGDIIVIVPHVAEGKDGDGEIHIPSGWVKSIVELTPESARKKKHA